MGGDRRTLSKVLRGPDSAGLTSSHTPKPPYPFPAVGAKAIGLAIGVAPTPICTAWEQQEVVRVLLCSALLVVA